MAQMTLHRLFPVGEQGEELKEEETLVELLPLPAIKHSPSAYNQVMVCSTQITIIIVKSVL